MRFESHLKKVLLVGRTKRFFAHCLLDEQEITAHCVNTGSMKGVLAPPQAALVSKSDNPSRKLAYTLEVLDVGGEWVGVNTHRTNRLAREAFESGMIAGINTANGDIIVPEVKIDAGRIDFVVEHTDGTKTFIEVKNVSLAEGTCARFPDSPTERGQKHLRELQRLREEGHRAIMLYISQRGDITTFEAAADIDPAYATLLQEAVQAGVEVYAFSCQVTPEEISVYRRLFFADENPNTRIQSHDTKS